MDPEILVYIAFFVIVAIVQGIGQKRKEARKRERAQPRAPDARSGAEPGVSGGEGRAAARSGADSGEKTSSEEMIPGDIWEEILGLARGEPLGSGGPGGTKGPGEPGTATRTREAGSSAGRRERSSVPTGQEIPGRRDQVSVYRPPGSVEEIPEFEARTLEDTEQAPTGPPPEGLGRPITDGRREARPRQDQGRGRGRRDRRAELFPEGTMEELRRAMVLKEVLGPPLALREGHEPV